MKRFLGVALLALAALATAGAQTLSSTNHTITWSWLQAGGGAPTCSITVTDSCGISYQLTWTDPTGKVGAPAVIAWPALSYVYGPGGFLYCGTWQGSLTLTYKDDTGTVKTTAPTTGTAAVACPFVLSPPSGLKGNPAP